MTHGQSMYFTPIGQRSHNGVIYKDLTSSTVIKQVPRDEYKEECAMHRAFARKKLAPTLVSVKTDQSHAFLTIKQMTCTLREFFVRYLRTMPPQPFLDHIVECTTNLVKKAHNFHLSHNDLHLNNVMLDLPLHTCILLRFPRQSTIKSLPFRTRVFLDAYVSVSEDTSLEDVITHIVEERSSMV